MKATIFAFVALEAAGVLSATEAECGALGVMDRSQVPSSVDADAVRKCIHHPLSHSLTSRNTPGESLTKRYCRHGYWSGCNNGYCWIRCGEQPEDGRWCWAATNRGYGMRLICAEDGHCTGDNAPPDQACGSISKGGDPCHSC